MSKDNKNKKNSKQDAASKGTLDRDEESPDGQNVPAGVPNANAQAIKQDRGDNSPNRMISSDQIPQNIHGCQRCRDRRVSDPIPILDETDGFEFLMYRHEYPANLQEEARKARERANRLDAMERQ